MYGLNSKLCDWPGPVCDRYNLFFFFVVETWIFLCSGDDFIEAGDVLCHFVELRLVAVMYAAHAHCAKSFCEAVAKLGDDEPEYKAE